MNARTTLLTLITAALSYSTLPSLSLAREEAGAMAYTVKAVRDHRDEAIVQKGTTTLTVLQYLGAPRQKLDRDVWVYTAFHASAPEADKFGCNTLLVTFTDSRVSDIKLVNRSARTVVAANLKAGPGQRKDIYVSQKQIAVSR